MHYPRCPCTGKRGDGAPRRGVVLLAVLIVLVLLSLAAYNYSDLMLSEYKASDNFHKSAQARAFADSGIHYAMAVLSSQDNINNMLNGNPFNNSQVFANHAVSAATQPAGYFTLIAAAQTQQHERRPAYANSASSTNRARSTSTP